MSALKKPTIDDFNKKSGFVQVNKTVLDVIAKQDISMAEKYTLTILFIKAWDLIGYVESSSDLPQLFESISKLASDLNVSEAYAAKLKKKLINSGYLKEEMLCPTRGTLLSILIPENEFKKVEKLKHIKRNQKNKPRPTPVPDKPNIGKTTTEIQSKVLDRINDLSKQRIHHQVIVTEYQQSPAKHRTINSGEQYDKSKKILASIRKELTYLNDKLYNIQKLNLDSRQNFGDLHEIGKPLRSKRDVSCISKFVHKGNVKYMLDEMNKMKLSLSNEGKLHLINQVIYSCLHGYFKNQNKTTRHCINIALKLIAENRWTCTTGQELSKTINLTRSLINKAKHTN